MPESRESHQSRVPRGPIFVAFVVVWAALLLWAPDLGWLAPFERGRELIHLGVVEEGDGVRVLLVDDRRSILIDGKRRGATSVHLGQLGKDPLPDYALTIQAAAGPAFTVLLHERGSGVPLRKIRIAERSSPQVYHRVLHGREMPSPVRLGLYHRNPRDVEILDLEVRELGPSWRWVLPAVRWLPALILAGLAWAWRRRGLRWLGAAPGLLVRSDAMAAVVVAAVCVVAYQGASVGQLLDGKFASVVGYRLVREGTLSLPPILAENPRGEKPYQVQPVGDRYYHFFPHVPMILNIPSIWVHDALGIEPLDDRGLYVRSNEIQILRVAAAWTGALLCVLLYLLGRIWLRPGPAVVLTGVFAFGSQAFSTISRPWWTHGWAATLLSAALLVLFHPRWRERPAAVYLGGLLLFGAFTCRPPLALAVTAVGVLFLWRARRRVGWLVAGGLSGAVAFVAYSRTLYGDLLPPYFLSSHLSSGRFRGENLVSSYPEALLGTLFSPGRGFFVFVPVSVAILVGVVWLWRRLDDRGLALAGLVVFVAHWQVVSSFQTWWGGQCFGPRFFSDVLPWFFVLGAMVWAAWIEERRSGGRPRPVLAALLVVLAAASVFVNTRGATERATFSWAGHGGPRQPRGIFRHAKLWNWRHPQFMAGLIPESESGDVEGPGVERETDE